MGRIDVVAAASQEGQNPVSMLLKSHQIVYTVQVQIYLGKMHGIHAANPRHGECVGRIDRYGAGIAVKTEIVCHILGFCPDQKREAAER